MAANFAANGWYAAQRVSGIVERGAAMIAVAQGDPLQAAHLVNQFRIPFPVLADPRRQVFQAYGLADGTLAQTLIPGVRHMASAAAQGNIPGIREHVRALSSFDGNSLRLLQGTFVVVPGGILRYAHVTELIHKHPPFEEVWTALNEVASYTAD